MKNKKLIKFYHVKDYLESGMIEMEGIRYDNTTMKGIKCEGVKMTSPYLYFKGEWALTKKGAIKLGNAIILQTINYHKKEIASLKKKLKTKIKF